MIYLILFGIIFWGTWIIGDYKNLTIKKVFNDGYGANFMAIGVSIILIIGIIIGIGIYISSFSNIAQMEAYYNETFSIYKKTIENSENITINAIENYENKFGEILNTGNLTYLELSKSVNENIIALRDKMKTYNNLLYVYRKCNSNWFLNSFIAEVPEYLEPIKMK